MADDDGGKTLNDLLTDPVEGEGGDGGKTSVTPPELPEEFKGMTPAQIAARAVELQGALTKSQQEKAEVVKSLEAFAQGAGGGAGGGATAAAGAAAQVAAPPPKPLDPELQATMIVDLKVDRLILADPELLPYKDELMEVLKRGATDPNVRVLDASINTAARFVKGNHLDEIYAKRAAATQEKERAKGKPLPSPTVMDTAPGAGSQVLPTAARVDVKLSQAQQENLLDWFGGDKKALRDGLLGEES